MPAVLGVAGAALLMVVLFVDVDGWATRFEQSFGSEPVAFSRPTIWRESLPIIGDFWLTGTGAGTYSDAMTLYQQIALLGRLDAAMGALQQRAFALRAGGERRRPAGRPPGRCWLLALTAKLGLRAVRADKGEMFWVRVGAAAGLAGLAAQSIWEVALIMPANAVLAGVVGGLLLYRRDP